MGFVLEPEDAKALIDKAPKNKNVLFPYLTGEDLNSRPNQGATRWVINFFDWQIEQAQNYSDCFKIISEKVKPEREKYEPKNSWNITVREKWWRFGAWRNELSEKLQPLQRALVIAAVSKTVAFVFAETTSVFSHKLIVIASDKFSDFAILQSALHYHWAWKYSSTMKTDLNYSPSDVFQTFPFPQPQTPNLQSLESIGEQYHEYRKQSMLARQEGLTKTYNRFHEAKETSDDIIRLRELHVEMDHAVAQAYGWSDLDLGHGFHETAQGMRYTLSEAARREVLARLLKLNHERWEDEQKALMENPKPQKPKSPKRKKGEGEGQGKLL